MYFPAFCVRWISDEISLRFQTLMEQHVETINYWDVAFNLYFLTTYCCGGVVSIV